VAIANLAALLLTRRLQGRPVTWVRRLSLVRRHPRDAGERVLARLLQVLAVSREAEELPGLLGVPEVLDVPDTPRSVPEPPRLAPERPQGERPT
jgi:hypothetical protein